MDERGGGCSRCSLADSSASTCSLTADARSNSSIIHTADVLSEVDPAASVSAHSTTKSKTASGSNDPTKYAPSRCTAETRLAATDSNKQISADHSALLHRCDEKKIPPSDLR